MHDETFPCPTKGCEVIVCSDPWDSCHDHEHELTREFTDGKLAVSEPGSAGTDREEN